MQVVTKLPVVYSLIGANLNKSLLEPWPVQCVFLRIVSLNNQEQLVNLYLHGIGVPIHYVYQFHQLIQPAKLVMGQHLLLAIALLDHKRLTPGKTLQGLVYIAELSWMVITLMAVRIVMQHHQIHHKINRVPLPSEAWFNGPSFYLERLWWSSEWSNEYQSRTYNNTFLF